MTSFSRKRILNIVTICFLLFVFSLHGCARHSATMERSSPAVKFTGKKQGAIDIIDIRLDQSKIKNVIGYHHEGYSFLKPVTYYGSHANYPKSIYIVEVAEELRNANYPIKDLDTSVTSVFAKEVQTQSSADLSIGGTISQLKFDSYSTVLTGRMSEAMVSVRWEVLDNTQKKIIYDKTTSGSAKGPMSVFETEPVTIAAAVRSSFRKLLSDTHFVNVVEKGLKRE